MDWKDNMCSTELVKAIYSHMDEAYLWTPDKIDTILNMHKQYNTYALVTGKGYARFNIEGKTAYIMDCVVIDGGAKTLRRLCKYGLFKFPYAKHIRFERQLKKRKDMRKYNLKDLIKEVS